jgi:hypothetical protein
LFEKKNEKQKIQGLIPGSPPPDSKQFIPLSTGEESGGKTVTPATRGVTLS